MKNLAFVSLVLALTALAAAVVSGLTGYSYAVLGLAVTLPTKHVSNEVLTLITFTNSFVRIGLLTAVAFAALSGSLAAGKKPASAKRCNKSSCR